MNEPALRTGPVEPRLAAELPGLALTWTALAARPRRAPAPVRRRLRALSDRFTGARVVHMRQDPIPAAYRAFARQVGLDPDRERTPVERVALERLTHGGFRSRGLVDDALTIAIAETGVPVVALDGDRVGRPGLRLARAGESLAGGPPLASGRIVVAGERRPLALVLGEVGSEAGVTSRTMRLVLAALGVAGVSRLAVEEALWIAIETLAGAEPRAEPAGGAGTLRRERPGGHSA